MNMPLVLLNRRRRGGAFSPTRLFALAEPGVWYDPSDLTTLFQDTAGTTPVTAPAQPVGRVLDKSQGLVLGPELVTNGDFSSGSTGWATVDAVANTTSVTNGELVNIVSTSPSGSQQLVTTVAGRTYRVSGEIRCGTSTDVRIRAVNSTFNGTPLGESAVVTSTGATAVSFVFTASSTQTSIYLRSVGVGTSFFDNISVRELPGFHATQATAASRPTYGIVPSRGRVNLLTFTEQFDNAAWAKANSTVTANAGTAPDGTMTADRLVDNTSAVVHAANQTIAVTSNTTYTLSFYAKASGRNWVTLDPVYPSVANNITYFDLANGAVGTSDPDNSNVTIIAVGDGWYRCSLRHTTAVGQTSMIFQIAPANANNGISYIGSGADGVLIWGAQLETGSTATNYQRVGSAFDVTEAGVPSLSYLFFDGVDDFLVTPTITPGTDKVQVFAGVRKLRDASIGTFAEFSTDATSNAGAFAVFAPVSGGAANYTFRSRGSGAERAATYTNAAVAAPTTNVLTGIGDIAGDNATLRVNGTQVAQSTADQGAGNYLAYPLYIGRRGGTEVPFNGQLYGLVVRFGANLDANTITNTETWVNGRTGAYA